MYGVGRHSCECRVRDEPRSQSAADALVWVVSDRWRQADGKEDAKT